MDAERKFRRSATTWNLLADMIDKRARDTAALGERVMDNYERKIAELEAENADLRAYVFYLEIRLMEGL